MNDERDRKRANLAIRSARCRRSTIVLLPIRVIGRDPGASRSCRLARHDRAWPRRQGRCGVAKLRENKVDDAFEKLKDCDSTLDVLVLAPQAQGGCGRRRHARHRG